MTAYIVWLSVIGYLLVGVACTVVTGRYSDQMDKYVSYSDQREGVEPQVSWGWTALMILLWPGLMPVLWGVELLDWLESRPPKDDTGPNRARRLLNKVTKKGALQ